MLSYRNFPQTQGNEVDAGKDGEAERRKNQRERERETTRRNACINWLCRIHYIIHNALLINKTDWVVITRQRIQVMRLFYCSVLIPFLCSKVPSQTVFASCILQYLKKNPIHKQDFTSALRMPSARSGTIAKLNKLCYCVQEVFIVCEPRTLIMTLFWLKGLNKTAYAHMRARTQAVYM